MSEKALLTYGFIEVGYWNKDGRSEIMKLPGMGTTSGRRGSGLPCNYALVHKGEIIYVGKTLHFLNRMGSYNCIGKQLKVVSKGIALGVRTDRRLAPIIKELSQIATVRIFFYYSKKNSYAVTEKMLLKFFNPPLNIVK